jgi:NhaA family Na+:H+ antiporter
VPLFALFSAGVAVSGGALGEVFTRPETLGVVLGLVVGKAVGIFGGTWLTARFTRASLSDDLAWPDVFAVSSLAGIGFTVSLLIGELAFDGRPGAHRRGQGRRPAGLPDRGRPVGTVLLKIRNAKYRRLWEDEERDEDLDGIPDIYEQDNPAYHLRMAEIHERKAAEHRRLAEVTGGASEENDGPA